MANIDVNALNQVVAKSLGQYHEAINSPPNDKEAALGLFDAAGTLDQIDHARQTFCSVWPKARGFIKMAISVLGFFVPGASAAGAILDAVEQQIVPVVCGPQS